MSYNALLIIMCINILYVILCITYLLRCLIRIIIAQLVFIGNHDIRPFTELSGEEQLWLSLTTAHLVDGHYSPIVGNTRLCRGSIIIQCIVLLIAHDEHVPTK